MIQLINIELQTKRVDSDHGREWQHRYVWEMIVNGDKKESKWEGFNSLNECIKDMKGVYNECN